MKKTKAGRAISAQSGAQCRVPGRRSAPVRPRFLRLRGPRRDGPMVAASDEVIAFRSPAIHPYELFVISVSSLFVIFCPLRDVIYL